MNRGAFLFALVVAGVLALAMFRSSTGARETQYEIEATQAEIARLEAEIALLQREYGNLGREEVLSRLARRELGMRTATASQFVTEERLDELLTRLQAREDAE